MARTVGAYRREAISSSAPDSQEPLPYSIAPMYMLRNEDLPFVIDPEGTTVQRLVVEGAECEPGLWGTGAASSEEVLGNGEEG